MKLKYIFALSICCLGLVSCGLPPIEGSESRYSDPSDPSTSTPVDDAEVEIVKAASLLEKGRRLVKRKAQVTEEDYYDIDEISFVNKVYQYNGQPHTLTISGMLPKGVRVEYQNNTRTEIGSTQATATLYDSENNILAIKTATLKVTEYTGFPNIYLDTNGAEITSKDVYVPLKVSTTNCPKDYEIKDIAGNIQLRGNGTLSFPKKAYKIKFDEKINLLGTNKKAKKWVLLADYADPSMLRNAAAFTLGDSLFNYSNNYSSHFQHVNVYLNNSYNGVYLLAEQQQVQQHRIDIFEPAENYEGTDIGYLLEMNLNSSANGGWGGGWGGRESSSISNPDMFAVNSPGSMNRVSIPTNYYEIKSDYYSQAQKTFISKYMNNVYKLMFEAVNNNRFNKLNENNDLVSATFSNAYECLNEVIDMESLFKMYYLQEIIKDHDVGYGSFYVFVDFSENSIHKRLTFGAPWDFDWSSGNVQQDISATGLYNTTNFSFKNAWLYMLSHTSFFNDYFKEYYTLFDESKIFDHVIDMINYETITFPNEFAKNYEKWKTLGTRVHNYSPNIVTSFKTHKDASDQFKNWITERVQYLDTQYLIK